MYGMPMFVVVHVAPESMDLKMLPPEERPGPGIERGRRHGIDGED
jgi:hypothetical protein